MFRSIRWTLQMWHAAILAFVLVVFGLVLFHFLHDATKQQVDADLSRMVDRIYYSVHPVMPPGSRPSGPRMRGHNRGNHPNRDPVAGNQVLAAPLTPDPPTKAAESPHAAAVATNDSPTAEPESRDAAAREPAPREPAQREPNPGDTVGRETARRGFRDFGFRFRHGEFKIELADDLKPAFDEDLAEGGYYYVVWRDQDGPRLRSKFAPEIALPDMPSPRRGGMPLRIVRQRGIYREAIRQTRMGLNVLVGRSMEPDLAILHEKGWMLAGAGIVVLVVGLAGGHWFSWRAIQPIQAISETTAEISLSNLSRRIDVTGTETELTGLARTLNQMFDRLESAFAQQVRFTADASHELRTPLAVILSHTELALSRNRPVQELRETIETCRRSAKRMKSLVESLLTLARFDSGEMRLEVRPFDLSRTVGDCISLVRPLAEQRRIAILMDLPPTSVTGDPDRLAQVVTNLLTNAIRYNRDLGQITVEVRTDSSEVVLSVADTGIGITAEHLPHVFERFFRVDKARTNKEGAVGLGLAICRSIVEAHGGSIRVTSRADEGTTFEVRLPKHGAADAAEPRREVASAQTMDLVETAIEASPRW